MATSIPSSFFTSPNFSVKSQPSLQSGLTSVRFGKSPISAAYTTTERTAPATEKEKISSFRIATPSSLYDVLGVPIGADIRQVKAAYRRLARVLHPDVGNRESSADEFMKVQSAYATLTDPVKRADYDRSLFLRRTSSAVTSLSPVRSGGGYSSRRWETDQCW